MARIALEIEDALHEEAVKIADGEDRSLSSLIRRAIKEYVDNRAAHKEAPEREACCPKG